MSYEELLSEKDAAIRCYVSKDTLRKWRAQGKGPAYLQLGRRFWYRLAAVEAFIASCEVTPSKTRGVALERKA